MDIYKALKLEEKSNKRFYMFMFVIGVILPLSLWLTRLKYLYLYIFLVIIEILLVLSILKRRDYTKLRYEYKNNKIKFVSGMFTKEKLIICDTVKIVHTNKMEDELEIIIVSTSKLRCGRSKPIVKEFLRKYPEISEEYLRLKKINPDERYYFQIIRKGGLKKYIFLNDIYRYCVKAVYTASCIQSIKIARGEIL